VSECRQRTLYSCEFSAEPISAPIVNNSHTSLERIFLVCVVVEGRASDPALLEELEKIDSGAVPHWHGLRADIHLPGQADAEDKAAHGNRIQVLFNAEKRGIAESRADAVQFIHMLAEKHENTGLKSPQEDLLLLFLQSGAEFGEHDWLSPVTGALIVPPPLITSHNKKLAALSAMKLANAVVFNTEGPGKRSSFDLTFTPLTSDADAADINKSDGNSYPAPVWNGAAIAMRLNTYRNLPAQDPSLAEEWPANLELSLNLWLCADGMDIIKDVEIVTSEPMPRNPLSPDMMARFAAAWMDDVTVEKVLHVYTQSFPQLTRLEFETLMSKARDAEDFPIDLTERCRSFSWYAEVVNTDITEPLNKAGEEIAKEKEQQAKEAAEKAERDAAEKAAQEMEQKAKEEADKKAAEEAAAKAAAEAEPKKAEDNAVPDMAHGEAPPDGENAVPDMAHGDEVAEESHQKPSIPLRPENMGIVQMPKKVDLAFVDVSHGHKEHPHLGAKDEDGNFGYVHDETALRLNPPPFSYAGDDLRNDCLKRDNDYRMLHEKVKLNLEGHKAAEAAAEANGKKRDKIFCLVYTIESGHPKIPAIRETWG
jgi:hypothetical protein